MKCSRAPVLSTAIVWIALLVAGCSSLPLDTPIRHRGLMEAPGAAASGDAARLTVMAEQASMRGDHTTAAGLLERAVMAEPSDLQATIGYGNTLYKLRRYQESVEVHRRALQLAPGDQAAARGFAKAMLGLNRPDAAATQLEEVFRARPDEPETLNLLAVTYDLQGRHRDAQAMYKQALALAPGDARIVNNLGLSLALGGEHETAISTLRRLAEGAGSDERTRQNLALAYGLAGDVQAASRLARLDLGESDVRNNLAIFAALRGLDSGSAALALVPVDPAPLPRREKAKPAFAPARPVPLAAVALGEGDMSVGASPVGSWFLNLGSFPEPEAATRRWLELRRNHPKDLGGLSKLAGAGGGREPLLVGPALGEKEAAALCGRVRKDVPSCLPIKL